MKIDNCEIQSSEARKKLIRNTLYLYFRMFFSMLVGLYTTRLTLKALGVVDYGMYEVVGGVVGMSTIFTSSLTAAVGRFLTFEIGKGDTERIKKVYSTCLTINYVICVIIVFVAETIGVWFINAKMVIPEERLLAANIVLQFSILDFAIGLICGPMGALIIAHEKMSAFAYIGILSSLLRLFIVILLVLLPFDKAILLSVLGFMVSCGIRYIYVKYCKKHFDEYTHKLLYDIGLIKSMFGFAGWNFIGASSAILRDQGGNMLLNVFCGPELNAARGIGIMVNSKIEAFVDNYMTAMNPQITKSYATENYSYMHSLLLNGSRYSFYLMLFLSLPVLMQTHFILDIWLKDVPEHAVEFVQLFIIMSLSSLISRPLITASLATGKIRNYQIVVGGLQTLNFPIAYFALNMGAIPESIVIIAIIISHVCFFARVVMLKKMIKLEPWSFIKKVWFDTCVVILFACILPFLLKYFINNESFVSFIIVSITCMLSSSLSIFYIGLNSTERAIVISKTKDLCKKIFAISIIKNKF